ncbi:alpha/beta fold hydrolase [Actinokineospora sp.]|uniref:alpha/beta fold hydrolase n=1 Tax=Actinokineospora sp. TaxID=1872133 RepID=UPI004037E51D
MADYFRTSDGVALAVVDTGTPDAPVTVLLTHGWTSDLRVWDEVAGALRDRVRVLRYDHRGHGGSDKAPRDTATLGRLADDLAELIADRVPTGRLVLVGHSMGGMTMMALAERHPDLVERRVAAAVFTATSSGRMGEVTFGLPKVLVKAAARRQSKARRPSPGVPRPARPVVPPSRLRIVATRAFLRWLVFGTRFRMVDVRSVADQAAQVHRGSAAALRRDIGKHARVAALAHYAHADTQVLVGELDRLTPLDHGRAIAAAMPHAEFVLYPAAGHMLPYERVPELAARILRAARTPAAAR